MKRVLVGFLVAALATVAYADIRSMSEVKLRDKYRMKTVCVDGYKFVVAHRKETGMSIVQMFIEKNGKSLPAQC